MKTTGSGQGRRQPAASPASHAGLRRARVASLLVCAPWLAFPTAPRAVEPEYVTAGDVAPTSADAIEKPMDEPSAEPDERVRLLPRLGAALDGLPPFFRDTQLALAPRLYSFDRERTDAPDQVSVAAGGALRYRSGLWRERARIAVTAYTTQKMHGPREAGGGSLLLPTQTGFGVIGEAYAELDLAPLGRLRLHRQLMNLPYFNADDARMIPITHEAYLLGRPDPGALQWVVGHVTRIKPRDSDRFMPISEAAGFRGTDEGATLAGARWNPDEDTSLAVINYASWDFLDIAYTEASRVFRPYPGILTLYSLQGSYQGSIGEELGGDSGTYHLGARASLSYRSAVLSLATSYTDDDAAIRTPFGGSPSYLSLMLTDFDRAGERAWLAAASYEFGRFGLPGVGVNVKYARGHGAGRDPDRDELDLTIDVKPGRAPVRGLWFRFRFATLEADDGLQREDVRFILNYEVNLL